MREGAQVEEGQQQGDRASDRTRSRDRSSIWDRERSNIWNRSGNETRAGAKMFKGVIQDLLPCMKEAGEIVRSQFGEHKDPIYKGRIDLVTKTDLAVEAFLRDALPKMLPGSSVLGEESHTTLIPDDLTWIVDPLDGTTNYAHGLPIFSTSVGLWHQEQVVLGAVYIPILDELFWAVRGQGAFLNGNPIKVSDQNDMVKSLFATGFPYDFHLEVDLINERFKRVLLASQGVRRFGSAAVDLAYTACGRFEGFYETGLHPWDTAAGWLLVEEAGGKVTGINGEKHKLGEYMIVATNGLVHDELLNLIQV